MRTTFDLVTRQFGQDASRRRAVASLGALALGALGLADVQPAAAVRNCKQKCKRDNCGTLSPRKCSRRCRRRCRDKD